MSARSIAALGIGFGARLLARLGIGTAGVEPSEPVPPHIGGGRVTYYQDRALPLTSARARRREQDEEVIAMMTS